MNLLKFRSSYCIKKDREQLEKFDAKSDDEIFLGYLLNICLLCLQQNYQNHDGINQSNDQWQISHDYIEINEWFYT